MKISHINNTLYFSGSSNSTTTEKGKCSAILDYDKVVAFINEHQSQERILKHRKKDHTSIRIGPMKDFTLTKLKHIHDKYAIDEIIRFHTTETGKENNLLFINIYRQRGKTFSINSYMREVITALKNYPNAIAKILLAKDSRTNIMPSLNLSKDIWYDLLKGVLKGADKEYLAAIEQELIQNSVISGNMFSFLLNSKQKVQKTEPIASESIKPSKPIKPSEPVTHTKRQKPVRKSSPLTRPPKVIIDVGKESIKELADFITTQETVGNVLWTEKPYKNHVNPMIFTLFDVINSETDRSLYQPILEKIKQNPLINFNLVDANRESLFMKILNFQNHDLLDVVKDRVIIYHPVYNSVAREIKDESFLAKLKECNVDFIHIDNAAKEKSFEKLDKIFSNLNSIFFSREKSGSYILKSVLETKDENYIFDFWRKYSSFIPAKSGKIIHDAISKMKF